MKSSAACFFTATALSAVFLAQAAPILKDFAVVRVPQSSVCSTTLAAAHKLLSLEHRKESIVDIADDTDEHKALNERMQERGLSDREGAILEAARNFLKDFEAASRDAGSPGDVAVEPLLFGSSKRKRPAWADDDPDLAHDLGVLRSKLPKHPNGMPDLDTLAAIAPEQSFALRYISLRKRIKNASVRASRAAAKALRATNAQPQASLGSAFGSKRKLRSEYDLDAARAVIDSPTLRRNAKGHIDIHRVSPEELKLYRAAQRVIYNSKRSEKRQARKLRSQSTSEEDTIASSNLRQASSSNAAPSTSTLGAASAHSAAVYHHDSAASPTQVSSILSTSLPPHAAEASLASSAPPQLPVQPIVEHASPASPPRSPIPLLRWPSFDVPIYSPPRFDFW